MSKNRRSISNHTPGLNATLVGFKSRAWDDIYYYFLRISWWQMLGILMLLYLVINILFASLFYMRPDSVANLPKLSFWNAFFFSVETLSTIGYGYQYPQSLYSRLLVTVESFAGILFNALTTGLIFAKFSVPQAKVVFSDKAVINPRNGKPHLSFRIANERQNHIVQAQISVSILLQDRTLEGQTGRKLVDLTLLRNTTPAFNLSWTVYHPIDQSSPFFRLTPDDLKRDEVFLIVSMVGLDSISSQTVHARRVYSYADILWDHAFQDVFELDAQGGRVLNHNYFHKTHPLKPLKAEDGI